MIAFTMRTSFGLPLSTSCQTTSLRLVGPKCYFWEFFYFITSCNLLEEYPQYKPLLSRVLMSWYLKLSCLNQCVKRLVKSHA